MIWNPNKECMSREDMRALQGKRLKKLVQYVYHNVPFYRHKMQEMDISPEDINSIDDIVKLPFTTKQDLRDNYPYGLQAAPPSEIVRVHASSGTTSTPPSWAIHARTWPCGRRLWHDALPPMA